MTTYNKYRVRCLADNIDEFWLLPEDDPIPTTCPTNTAHEIDNTQTTIVDTIEDNQVTIKEESIPTGGNFAAQTINIDAPKNSIASKHLCWPFPISALTVQFVSVEKNRGDCISLAIGQDTPVGAILTPIIPAIDWTPKNYKAGDNALFIHPVHGQRVYTCVEDTVNNENPTDISYWTHGFLINVTPTVVKNVKRGYYIALTDGTNYNDLGRLICLDAVNGKIRVEKNPTNIFSPLSPTYVLQSIYMVRDYELSAPWEHDIGNSKIGGSYIPADVMITIYYQNHSDEDKHFVGRVEYLY